MAAASKAKKELAAERDKLAGLKHEKQALEQQLAAAAARDADACAAAARAMRAAVAATPLESDPAADARRDLREKRATLREQQALLAAWTCVARANAYAPHADLIWMETAKPILSQAAGFAQRVHEKHPGKMLAYNLSPSFNWDAAGMSDKEIESFTGDLAAHGFVWQFITLAGFHSNGLMTHNFVQEYAKRGMGAYVEMIQREERRTETPVLKHQGWSGAELANLANEAAIVLSSTCSSRGGSAPPPARTCCAA